MSMMQTTLHPIIGELLASYRVTGAALILLIAVTTYSHIRRTRAVRSLSLLLPVHVAAIEACRHFTWFGRCHSFTALPTLDELRHELLMAATASVVALAVAMIVAAILLKVCRAGIAGNVGWRAWLAAPPLASVVIIWAAADVIFFQAW